MKAIVDSSVWSLVLRRSEPDLTYETLLKEIIHNQRLVIVGVIKQEILSGILVESHFKKLSQTLSFFQSADMLDEDFELAASYYNQCRKKGIQGSHTDYLICALATRFGAQILTTDKDFNHYARVIPIQLYQI